MSLEDLVNLSQYPMGLNRPQVVLDLLALVILVCEGCLSPETGLK